MQPDQSLEGLRARVEAATGPDRVLDGDLQFAFMGCIFNPPPSYTASTDAALALVERMKPGHGCLLLSKALDNLWQAFVFEPSGDRIARALIAALLTALEQEPAAS